MKQIIKLTNIQQWKKERIEKVEINMQPGLNNKTKQAAYDKRNK